MLFRSEAVTLDPDSPEIRFNLGVACLKAGDREGALGQYRVLKGVAPQFAGQLYRSLYADKLLFVGGK